MITRRSSSTARPLSSDGAVITVIHHSDQCIAECASRAIMMRRIPSSYESMVPIKKCLLQETGAYQLRYLTHLTTLAKGALFHLLKITLAIAIV